MRFFGVELIRQWYHKLSGDSEAKVTRIIRYPGVLEVRFSAPTWKYRSGQWALLNYPEHNRQEWQPYTITSTPYDSYISVHVPLDSTFGRALGKVHDAPEITSAIIEDEEPQLKQFVLHIDGPYGKPATDIFNNNISILIGTDAGVFPWMSVLKELWHRGQGKSSNSKPLPGIEIVWISNMVMFEAFQTLLEALKSHYRISKPSETSYLRIHVYDTRELDMDTINNIVLNSVGEDLDPITIRTDFGRPNFVRLLTSIRNRLLTGEIKCKELKKVNVGVYFCGSSSTAEEIINGCNAATCRDVHFRFWNGHP